MLTMRPFLSVLLLILLTACGRSAAYREQYRHLSQTFHQPSTVDHTPYFLILAVAARHLDYFAGDALLKTLAKHPSDGSKNGDVGHAWILLHGMENGRCFLVEGGHSGELGIGQPKYFDGVMNYIEYGDLDPTSTPQAEPNPVKYLWAVQKDGFFQRGTGGHRPTFAVKVELTQGQFEAIHTFMDRRHYDFVNYAITGNQCASFVAKVAEIAGLQLNTDVTIRIPHKIHFGREGYVLWQDPAYREITIGSPDILEKSLMEQVRTGKAQYALLWYLEHYGFRKIPNRLL